MSENLSTSLVESHYATRKTRLREFQVTLAERLRHAKTESLGQGQLAILISNTSYLIDLAETGEIVPISEITSVPLTKPWYRGVVNLRGNVFSVIDFAQFLGQSPTVIDKNSRILTFADDLRINAGILVSRVFGLRNTLNMRASSDQDYAILSVWLGAPVTDADNQRWYPLSFNKLVRDERFLEAGI